MTEHGNRPEHARVLEARPHDNHSEHAEHAEQGVDFGRRLRLRRIEAGLSQTDLAGGDMSPSYVSLLESGKRAPTADVVRKLSNRLGCTVDELLEGTDASRREHVTLAVRFAELALNNGEPAEALRGLDDVLASQHGAGRAAARTIAPALVGEIAALRARALESTGAVEQAIAAWETYAEICAQERRWADLMRVQVHLARCYREVGDMAQSLDVGRAALRRVEQLGMRGSDVHAELVSSVVAAHFLRGDVATADALATSAMADLAERGPSRARAAVAWNASVVADAAGRTSDALQLAEHALALYADGDDPRAVARLRVTYGWLLLRSAPPAPEQARKELEAALDELADVGSAVDRAYCHTELARAGLLQQDAASALRHVESAEQLLGSASRLESASCLLVRGAVHIVLGEIGQAKDVYRAAAAMLGEMDASRLAAGAWRELADACSGLGMLEEAALAYQQALSDAGVPAAPRPGQLTAGFVAEPHVGGLGSAERR